MTAHARITDPWTSWAAAEGIADVKPSEAAVLALFAYVPDESLTLELIVEGVDGLAIMHDRPRFSDSRIRTATVTLVRDGHLRYTGKTALTKRGNPAKLIGRPLPTPTQERLL